jgi:hypothetical protein
MRAELLPIAVLASAASALACSSGSVAVTMPPPVCSEVPDATAAIADVTGVHHYRSLAFALAGNIAFTQAGTRVTVGGVTYDNADDRPLMGQADLVGNSLDVVLVPTNGDTDYRADVSFIFDQQGTSFCLLGFSDTNGDTGGPGSYFGSRL